MPKPIGTSSGSCNKKDSISVTTSGSTIVWSTKTLKAFVSTSTPIFAYQSKLLRFLENHDEPRAASVFAPAKERAAAVATSTLLGARMFHEGQLEGRKVRLPVFLSRRPHEPVDHDLQDFYTKLLRAINAPIFREGDWTLCERTGWPDNASFENIVAWRWSMDEEAYLIVVNLSDSRSQALSPSPVEPIERKTVELGRPAFRCDLRRPR